MQANNNNNNQKQPNKKQIPNKNNNRQINNQQNASNSSVPQQQQQQQQANNQTIYEEYWSMERVQECIATKTVIVGKLRINQRSYEDAFISDPVLFQIIRQTQT